MSDDQFRVSKNDLIGWTIDREDGVISLRYTEEQNVYFRDLVGRTPVVRAAYRFMSSVALPAIFSIAARVNNNSEYVVRTCSLVLFDDFISGAFAGFLATHKFTETENTMIILLKEILYNLRMYMYHKTLHIF